MSTQPQVIIVQTQKSPMLAAVLGFFFGPLGLLYVGSLPAFIMFGVNLVLAVLTVGVGFSSPGQSAPSSAGHGQICITRN